MSMMRLRIPHMQKTLRPPQKREFLQVRSTHRTMQFAPLGVL
jgi:hypothetical protein